MWKIRAEDGFFTLFCCKFCIFTKGFRWEANGSEKWFLVVKIFHSHSTKQERTKRIEGGFENMLRSDFIVSALALVDKKPRQPGQKAVKKHVHRKGHYIDYSWINIMRSCSWKQARKAPNYASSKLRLTDQPTDSLTGVKCRATSVAQNWLVFIRMLYMRHLIEGEGFNLESIEL